MHGIFLPNNLTILGSAAGGGGKSTNQFHDKLQMDMYFCVTGQLI